MKSTKKIIIAIIILAVIAFLVYGICTTDFAKMFGEETALLNIQRISSYI